MYSLQNRLPVGINTRRQPRAMGDLPVSCGPGEMWYEGDGLCHPVQYGGSCPAGTYPQPIWGGAAEICVEEGQGGVVCPEGTYGSPPNCVAIPGYGTPSTTTQCPDGTYGIPPNCIEIPGGGAPTTGGECPAGQYGVPPYCVDVPSADPGALPGGGIDPTTGQCQAGYIGTPPYCVPDPGTVPGGDIPVPGGTTPEPTPAIPGGTAEEKGWWEARSDLEKVAIVAGGVVGAYLLYKTVKKGR